MQPVFLRATKHDLRTAWLVQTGNQTLHFCMYWVRLSSYVNQTCPECWTWTRRIGSDGPVFPWNRRNDWRWYALFCLTVTGWS